MSGSSSGKIFKITTWGESHGEALGVVVDGCPAGIPLSKEDIQPELDKRAPGGKYSTGRNEADRVQILSGVFEGKTTGTPIMLAVFNSDQRPSDYENIKDLFRPSHADYTFWKKYGIRDYRGGGRSSGRETIGRVAAGAVAKKMLSELNIRVLAYTYSIHEIEIDRLKFDESEILRNPLKMPDADAAQKASAFLDGIMLSGDSAGGVAECIISGLPAGIGEPVFDKLDANIAKAVMSIGAVKGVEFGNGFLSAGLLGSENNDPFFAEPGGGIKKAANSSGGILGGISDGDTVIFRAAVKPTPSISIPQKTVSKDGENTEITITGRHDPVIVPRIVPVIEAMAAITTADLLLENMASEINRIKGFYGL